MEIFYQSILMQIEFKTKISHQKESVVTAYLRFQSLWVSEKIKSFTENNKKCLIKKFLNESEAKISVLDLKIKNLKHAFLKVLDFCLLGGNNYTQIKNMKNFQI